MPAKEKKKPPLEAIRPEKGPLKVHPSGKGPHISR